MTNKKPITHGGKRPGAGRRKRPNAVKKTVLIEKTSIATLVNLGDGYLGRGIDEAAVIIERQKAKP